MPVLLGSSGALLVLTTLWLYGRMAECFYSEGGPCMWYSDQKHVTLPPEAECGQSCSLSLTLTGPRQGTTGACPPPPYPVVVVLSGFQMFSSYYLTYAQHLASFGYVVLQYDTQFLHVVNDRVEVGWFPMLLSNVRQWAHHQQGAVRGPAYVDLTNVATVGHSRGGTVAALLMAAHPDVIQTAFLIDPVDNQLPPTVDYPSAVEAIRKLGRRVAIVGASLHSSCNPEARAASAFLPVLPGGSWLEVVQQAGHMQFANITNFIERTALDLVCHAGTCTHEEVIHLTIPPLVTWMESTFREDKSGTQDLLREFRQWLTDHLAAGDVTFLVKNTSSYQVKRS